MLKKIWQFLYSQLSEDDDNSDIPKYDPLHIGAVIVVTLTILTLLFWLLWTILVYGGGIFPKLKALAIIIFTNKSFKDFGYESFPYNMGVFDGIITNTVGILLLFFVCYLIWRMYKKNTITKS